MYLILVCAVLLMAITVIIVPVMACSGYVIIASSYYQLLGIFLEGIFFSVTIALHFTTAAVASDSLLMLMTGALFLCSLYFFVSNGLARPIIRRNILCQKDDRDLYGKGKPYAGQKTPTTVSSMSQVSKQSRKMRQKRITQKDEMNLEYVNGYLGYPIEFWSEVGEGRRIRRKGFFSNGYVRGSSEV